MLTAEILAEVDANFLDTQAAYFYKSIPDLHI